MNHAEMTDRIATGEGFIAALDQSGGSTPKALTGYGIEDGSWTGEEEMFALIHDMRSRIIESPCFGNGKVIGAILLAIMLLNLIVMVMTRHIGPVLGILLQILGAVLGVIQVALGLLIIHNSLQLLWTS